MEINKKVLKIALIITGITFILAVLYCIANVVMEDSKYYLRSLVQVFGILDALFLFPTAAVLSVVLKLYQIMKRKEDKLSVLIPEIGMAFVLLLYTLYFLAASFFCMLLKESTIEEEKILESGILQGTTGAFLGGSNDLFYNFYECHNPFVKKLIYSAGYQESEYVYDPVKIEQAKQAVLNPQVVPQVKGKEQVKPEETEEIDEETSYEVPLVQEGEFTTEGACKKLYEEVFKGQGADYEENYNAKGNFYAILRQEDGMYETTKTPCKIRETLVYNGESENGLCQIFVWYREYYDQDGMNLSAAILDFYAVNKKTGEVTNADKKAWDQLGNEKYQKATEG